MDDLKALLTLSCQDRIGMLTGL